MPAISFETGTSYREISPLDITHIPITITNLGNGKTEVLIEVEDISENFDIIFPESTIIGSLAEGEKNTVTFDLRIKPKNKHFSREIIRIKITPGYFISRTGLSGKTYAIDYVLKNDGSYIETIGGLEIGILLLISIIVAISAVVLALIIRRKKSK